MNKQRKVVITTTYNEMGIIIDTKAEELGSSAQLGTNLAEVGTDLISRQAALDIFDDYNVAVENGQIEAYSRDRKRLCDLPPAQPEHPEIINCKDCKHRDPENRRCRHGAQWCPIPKEDKDYCSFAERRDERV